MDTRIPSKVRCFQVWISGGKRSLGRFQVKPAGMFPGKRRSGAIPEMHGLGWKKQQDFLGLPFPEGVRGWGLHHVIPAPREVTGGRRGQTQWVLIGAGKMLGYPGGDLVPIPLSWTAVRHPCCCLGGACSYTLAHTCTPPSPLQGAGQGLGPATALLLSPHPGAPEPMTSTSPGPALGAGPGVETGAQLTPQAMHTPGRGLSGGCRTKWSPWLKPACIRLRVGLDLDLWLAGPGWHGTLRHLSKDLVAPQGTLAENH